MDPRQLVVFGACLTQFMVIGLLSSFGLFFAVLEEEFGWSRALLSGSTSLAFLTMGVLAFFGGRLNDRYGPTVVLGAAGVLFGIGYALIPQVDEPWQLLVIFALFIGAGLGTHDVVTLSVIARWFEHRRGIMTGVAKVGAACGQMLLPPSVALLLLRLDWRDAVLAVGSAAAVLLLIAALSMQRAPDDRAPPEVPTCTDPSSPRPGAAAPSGRSAPCSSSSFRPLRAFRCTSPRTAPTSA